VIVTGASFILLPGTPRRRGSRAKST
jgi:hypothetical protein